MKVVEINDRNRSYGRNRHPPGVLKRLVVSFKTNPQFVSRFSGEKRRFSMKRAVQIAKMSYNGENCPIAN